MALARNLNVHHQIRDYSTHAQLLLTNTVMTLIAGTELNLG